ncbi:phospholipase A and acyltransferase 4-like [Pagrus major]|uniref:phospholipase A and acyltransferase 4-like n=1 Tax=Pagrus major TaxID=143350 RepID=UPI003CC875D2
MASTSTYDSALSEGLEVNLKQECLLKCLIAYLGEDVGKLVKEYLVVQMEEAETELERCTMAVFIIREDEDPLKPPRDIGIVIEGVKVLNEFPSSKSDQKPEPGDLIEIFRGGYQHWAVYVGNGCVVHVTSPPVEFPSKVSNSSMSVMVVKEKLQEVVGNDTWRINNSLDKEYEPRSACIIVEEADRLADKRMKYSVISKNCEHFAKELRYGKAESCQVRQAGKTVMAAGVAEATGLGILYLAGALEREGKKENKNTQ